MITKLTDGETAPGFSVEDIYGQKISLDTSNTDTVLVSFFRYAGCPWCNLAIYRLGQIAPVLEKKDLKIICFVQSTKENILKNIIERHTPKPSFHIVADPQKTIYDLYAVEDSALKAVPSLLKIPQWIKSVRKHHFPQADIDGSMTLVPAQFILGRHLKILRAHYGLNYADELTFQEIYEIALFDD